MTDWSVIHTNDMLSTVRTWNKCLDKQHRDNERKHHTTVKCGLLLQIINEGLSVIANVCWNLLDQDSSDCRKIAFEIGWIIWKTSKRIKVTKTESKHENFIRNNEHSARTEGPRDTKAYSILMLKSYVKTMK